jgi:membrane protease YdiL (CAAX protease family)/NAD-dependent dihydropyrimidine dehydrogenase PreA subunit
MAKQAARLRLSPENCDRCGRCLDACDAGAIKVGASYIYVDWRKCDGCYACADACDRGAITRRDEPARSAPAKRARGDTSGSAKNKASKASAKTASSATGGGLEWSITESVAILAVVFAAFVAKDVALNSPWVSTMSPSEAVSARVFVLALFYAIQVAALWGLARLRDEPFLDAYALSRVSVGFKGRVVSVALVLGLLVATRAAVLVYQVIARAAGWQAPVRWNSDLTAVFGPEQAGFVLSVLLVVLVAPLIEEMVFRGVVRGALDVRWGMWPAIGVSAGLFAAYHFNAWLIVPTFVLGLATGWLASTRTGLWPAIWLHALFNAVPVVLAFWPVS